MATKYLHKNSRETLEDISETLYDLSRPEEVTDPNDVTTHLCSVVELTDDEGTPIDHYVMVMYDETVIPVNAILQDDEVYERIMGNFWPGLDPELKEDLKDYIQTHDTVPIGPLLNNILGANRVLNLSELHDNGWYLPGEFDE